MDVSKLMVTVNIEIGGGPLTHQIACPPSSVVEVPATVGASKLEVTVRLDWDTLAKLLLPTQALALGAQIVEANDGGGA